MAKKDNTFSLDNNFSSFIDWSLLFSVLALIVFGLMSIYSATYGSHMSSFFWKQVIATGIGLALMAGIIFVPSRLIKSNSYVFYGISIILLVAVYFFGTESHGTKGWLRFAGLSIQPAEFAKIGLLLVFAKHLSSKYHNVKNIRDLVILSLLAIVPVALIILQPDIGTSTVLIAMAAGILFWAGFDAFFLYFVFALPVIMILALTGQIYFVIGVVVLSLLAFLFRKKIYYTIAVIIVFVAIGYASPIIYNNLMDHQKARIQAFLNPGADPRGTGYNVIQSKLAVGSGGLFGKGYLQGTQTQLRYIPMQWTDFVFSVPTEEFGFIGGTLVILLQAFLIYRAIRMANESDSTFFNLVSIGAATLWLYHNIINIGMAIGLMPVMGIPLPFMSYGGTSMLVNLILVGLLMNAYRNNKKKRSIKSEI